MQDKEKLVWMYRKMVEIRIFDLGWRSCLLRENSRLRAPLHW